jgi:hypothetical protein
MLGKAARGLLLFEEALVGIFRYAKLIASSKESFMFYS